MHGMRAGVSPYPSLLPKVEQVYWAFRSLVLLGLVFYFVVAWPEGASGLRGWGLLLIYALVLAVPALLVRLCHWRFEQVFTSLFLLDVVSITWLVHITGDIASNFFVLYYAFVPFAAYYLGPAVGLGAAALVTVIYAVPCFSTSGLVALPEFTFRAMMLWVFTASMGMASRFVDTFAQRLLNAMDKLNERTSELERTHTQLQTIYETSRSLAELRAVENVIDRVLSIARSVLNYPICELYTWDPVRRRLFLKGRLDETTVERLERSIAVEPNEIFARVIRDGDVARVVDRHLGRTVIDGSARRSQLVVPMVSEGRLIGLLNAESPQVNAFGERDERVFSILAASTAMALVNADLHQQMEKLTIVDELTGVYNFRHFRTRLEDEKRRAVRYGQPLSLIMVDIDWFKTLNDRYGHEIGNVALRQLVRVIGACVRDVDTLARYGGEEFIIILPQTGTEEAHTIGERIRAKVEETEFGPDTTGRPIHLTVSIGISCYPDNGRSEENLVESVDQALYRAKGGGRNAVRLT
ncbi:MAG: sensor domain-containing diguanylate cyclase [candidate division Zixibacteria bacterium]|nr:sensor domain-containing diguanylate cyclase [candidate division Zixibacteria bacterium]